MEVFVLSALLAVGIVALAAGFVVVFNIVEEGISGWWAILAVLLFIFGFALTSHSGTACATHLAIEGDARELELERAYKELNRE